MWEQKFKIFVELPFIIEISDLVYRPCISNYLDEQSWSHYFPPPCACLNSEHTGAEYIFKRIIFSSRILAGADGGDIAQQ